MPKGLPEIYLATARELFVSDSDEDIRDLVYVELLTLIGNRNRVASLHWKDIRIDVKAVVFEKRHYEYDRNTFQSREWYEEIERYPLSEYHLEILKRLSDRLQDAATNAGITFPDFVFCYTSYRGFLTSGWNSTSPQRRFHTMHNTAPKEIIERISNHIALQSQKKREKAIEESPMALKLRMKIEKTRIQLAQLEHDLNYVVQFGKMPPKQKQDSKSLEGVSIEELDLPVRVYNSLKRTGITTVEDVHSMLQRGPDAMLAIRNFGEASLAELTEKMAEKGYL